MIQHQGHHTKILGQSPLQHLLHSHDEESLKKGDNSGSVLAVLGKNYASAYLSYIPLLQYCTS